MNIRSLCATACCTANGRALFASGSRFAPVLLNGRTHVPDQGNNAYIFPAVGLGVIAAEAKRITDEMFFVAAKELANQVTAADLDLGRLYPPFTRIRTVSTPSRRQWPSWPTSAASHNTHDPPISLRS